MASTLTSFQFSLKTAGCFERSISLHGDTGGRQWCTETTSLRVGGSQSDFDMMLPSSRENWPSTSLTLCITIHDAHSKLRKIVLQRLQRIQVIQGRPTHSRAVFKSSRTEKSSSFSFQHVHR